MRKFLFAVVALVASFAVNAQILEPVKWSTSVEKLSDTEFDLVSKATIDKGWHLYSQTVPEDGPIATSFIYDDSEGNFTIEGNTIEEEGHTVKDPVFDMEIKYFENEAIFKQHVKVKEGVTVINGFVEFVN